MASALTVTSVVLYGFRSFLGQSDHFWDTSMSLRIFDFRGYFLSTDPFKNVLRIYFFKLVQCSYLFVDGPLLDFSIDESHCDWLLFNGYM